jgi:hypothetical protein
VPEHATLSGLYIYEPLGSGRAKASPLGKVSGDGADAVGIKCVYVIAVILTGKNIIELTCHNSFVIIVGPIHPVPCLHWLTSIRLQEMHKPE